MARMRGASPRGVILLLAFTWSVHLAANAAFLIRNPGEPPISDGTHQIASTYSVSTGLKVNGAAGLWLEARDSNAEWPPLVSMVTVREAPPRAAYRLNPPV